jgi:hypothetical protein
MTARLVRLAAVLAAAAALAVSPFAQSAQHIPSIPWRTVAPGVEHAHLQRTIDAAGEPAGPFSIHVLRVDLSKTRLDVVHAMDEAVGLETTSSIAGRTGAIAAINGGYFRTTGTFRGDSTGTLQIDRTLLSEPDRGRSAVGFVTSTASTRLIFGRVDWTADLTVGGNTQRIDGLNRARGADDLVVFTPGFHRTTLTDDSGIEIVVRSGRVTDVRDRAGSTPIPPDGIVLSARGAAREWALAALQRGAAVGYAMRLRPAEPNGANPWSTAEDILAAGPRLIASGAVDISTAREQMLASFGTDRHPRTAIAALADGRALLVVVDGRQPSSSVGMSLQELAQLLLEFGAVDAINLDGGGSTTMVVDREVVNRPSDPTGERPVSDAIIVRAR